MYMVEKCKRHGGKVGLYLLKQQTFSCIYLFTSCAFRNTANSFLCDSVIWSTAASLAPHGDATIESATRNLHFSCSSSSNAWAFSFHAWASSGRPASFNRFALRRYCTTVWLGRLVLYDAVLLCLHVYSCKQLHFFALPTARLVALSNTLRNSASCLCEEQYIDIHR